MNVLGVRVAQIFFVVISVAGLLSLQGGALFAQVGDNEVTARRAQLEQELASLEVQIEKQRGILQNKQRESVSLERDIAILNAQIEKARLSIRARNLTIRKLSGEIGKKEGTIDELTLKIEREKESLAQLVRKTNELDDFSLVEIILSNKDFSDFFVDLDSFVAIKGALHASVGDVRVTRSDTEVEKISLEDKRSDEVELRAIQELEKRRIEEREEKKEDLLDISRGEEEVYLDVLAVQEKSAAAIRTELFTLRGSAAIPFGDALELANIAYKETSVRPAFLLGIIAEESNLGENVGTGNWKTDMHPTRDKPVFEQITAELGLDPDLMPVSRKPWYGWGGAMGPAQFIPSTWILYKEEIGNLTGHRPPNPWDPYDAFMASSVLLRDNGAARGGYANERLAALRYFAGWVNAEKSSYAFYGDDVMELAEKYQKQIDILER